MVITIPSGKIILSQQEILVKLNRDALSLQARHDDISLYASTCLMVAHSGTTKWVISVESLAYLELISREIGAKIHP